MDSLFVGLVLASAALYAGWHTSVRRHTVAGKLALHRRDHAALLLLLVAPQSPIPHRRTEPCLSAIARSRSAVCDDRGGSVHGRVAPSAVRARRRACLRGCHESLRFRHLCNAGKKNQLYLLAGTASLVIAAMMLSNGLGARASAAPFAYMAWVFLLRAPVVALTTAFRRGQLSRAIGTEPVKVAGTGACATIAYGLSIYASAYAPMGGVAALRETSVVMAALMGTIVLGERPWLPRVLPACVVTAGAVLVATTGPR
jgi:uncharacterized membrane protein